MIYYVCLTTNKINNKKYIGKSSYYKDPDKHTYLGSGVLIKKAIKKYGKENFTKEILEIFDNENDALQAEIRYIKKFNALEDDNFYNLSTGGEGMEGMKMTEEIKKKMSESSKGIKSSMYGKTHSQETKEKMSKSRKGKLKSEEWRKKISESQRGAKSNKAKRTSIIVDNTIYTKDTQRDMVKFLESKFGFKGTLNWFCKKQIPKKHQDRVSFIEK